MDAKSLPEIIKQARAELKSGHYDDCCYVSFDFVTRLLDLIEQADKVIWNLENDECYSGRVLEAIREYKKRAEVLEGK
jgi:hypothetical protein